MSGIFDLVLKKEDVDEFKTFIKDRIENKNKSRKIYYSKWTYKEGREKKLSYSIITKLCCGLQNNIIT